MALRFPLDKQSAVRQRGDTKNRLRQWVAPLLARLQWYWLGISALLVIGDVAITATTFGRDINPLQSGVLFNIGVLVAATALSIGTGALWPSWWRRVIVALAVVPCLVLLVTSGNLITGLALAALVIPLIWLSSEIIRCLCPEADALERWSIGTALGMGIIGLLGFLLGSLGVLRPLAIWPIAAASMATLILTKRCLLLGDLATLRDWCNGSAPRQALTLLLPGIGLGLLWLNFLGALAPEVRPDAIRQRLATAVQFAHYGNLAVTDPDLTVAKLPAFGEITYAIAISVGATQNGKLLHCFVSLCCAATLLALGRRLAGNWAGVIAALTFTNSLIVAYLAQSAYVDLLSTLFIVAASLCLILGIGVNWRLVIAAGFLIGLSVATKLAFGYIAVGLGVAALLIGWPRNHRRTIFHLACLGLSAGIAAAPFLIRSYLLSKAVPGVLAAATSLSGTQTTLRSATPSFGYGRSWSELVTAPLSTVLLGRDFGGSEFVAPAVIGGHLGYVLLGLLPLLITARRSRPAVALFLGSVVMCLFWFFTEQYLRYALPAVALLCVVASVAFTTFWRQNPNRPARIALTGFLLLFTLASTYVRVQLPDTARDLATGRQSREDYLDRWLGQSGAGSYPLIQTLNAEPNARRVFALYDGARLYSPVRISNAWTTAPELAFEGGDDEILARLASGGFTHIMVDRIAWWNGTWSWDKMSAVNEDFLQRNAILVDGGNYSYLYRLLTPAERALPHPWTKGGEILDAHAFTTPLPNDSSVNKLIAQDIGTDGRRGSGAIQISAGSMVQLTTSIHADTRYLFALASQSTEGYGATRVNFAWYDMYGRLISQSAENMPATPLDYHRFSALVTAPNDATSLTITINVYKSTVSFDDLSLRLFNAANAPQISARK